METKVIRMYLCDGEACPKEKRDICIYDRIDQTSLLHTTHINTICEHTTKPEHSIRKKLSSSIGRDGFTPTFIIDKDMPEIEFEILDRSLIQYSIPRIKTWTTL